MPEDACELVVSDWSRWVFSGLLIRRCVAIVAGVLEDFELRSRLVDGVEGLCRSRKL